MTQIQIQESKTTVIKNFLIAAPQKEYYRDNKVVLIPNVQIQWSNNYVDSDTIKSIPIFSESELRNIITSVLLTIYHPALSIDILGATNVSPENPSFLQISIPNS